MRSIEDLAIADVVFQTGRTGTNLVIAFCGAFAVVVSVRTRGQLMLLNPFNMVCALGGAAVVTLSLLARRNSLVALFPEGLVFRNWRAQEVFLPWETISEVFIEHPDRLSRNASWLCRLYLVTKTPDGETQKIRLAADDSDDRVVRMASALAQRASLTHRGGTRARREVWDRTPADAKGQPSFPEEVN
jgi:hypothetical protein